MAIWICKIYARYESCKECYYTNSHRCRSNYRVNIATIVHVALASLCSYCAQYEQYIVANTGTTTKGETGPSENVLNDKFRIEFFEGYIDATAEAVKEGDVDIRSYLDGRLRI